MALSHAVMVIGWQEHLLDAEMPPRWMWTLDEELSLHFDWVKSQRNSGDSGEHPEDSGPMLRNEYAKSRGRNAR